MEADKTTLKDLAIFVAEEEQTVLNSINFARTSNGREQLRKTLDTPLNNIQSIRQVQDTIRLIAEKSSQWPHHISNGTIMVVERFYATTIDVLPRKVSGWDAFTYKIFHGADYSLVKYSAIHCFDLLKGMHELVQLFLSADCPLPLKKILEDAERIVNEPHL